MAAALLAAAAVILLMNGEAWGLAAASSSPGYEARLFDSSRVDQVEIVIKDWEKFLDEAPKEQYSP